MVRRFLALSLAVLLTLAVVAVVTDRVLHARAEEEVAANVSEQAEVDGDPAVTIHGVPFVTQVLAGNLEHVTLQAEGVRYGELVARDVVVEARGVTTAAPRTAERIEARATVPVSSVRDQLEGSALGSVVDVSLDQDVVELTTELFGAELVARARPVVAAGGMQLQIQDLRLGERSVGLSDLGIAEDARSIAVPVPGLPEGVEITGVQAVDAGLRVVLRGRDVALEMPAS